MKIGSLVRYALGMLALSGSTAFGTIVNIDSFTFNQQVDTNATFANGTADGSEIFGNRWMQITRNGVTTEPEAADSNIGFAGELTFSNSNHDSANALVQWDSDSSTGTLDFAASPVDLTVLHTNNIIRIEVVTSDHAVANGGTLTLWQSAGVSSTINFNIPLTAVPFDIDLPFSSFVGTADPQFTRAIQLTLNGIDQEDMSLDFIESTSTGAPEPATMALFGTGLAGLGVLLRRRKV